MCGRFTLSNPDPALVAKTFNLDTTSDLPSSLPADRLTARFNVAPMQAVAAVVRDTAGHNHLTAMRWGLVPSWSKDASGAAKMINARAETAPDKPSFRAAFSKRRCLIVADGFYEWQKHEDGTKTPMYITVADHKLFGFAGLWEPWTDPASGSTLLTCTILTTEPNGLMEPIHNRMPVILSPEAYTEWLDPAQTDKQKAAQLLVKFPADQMVAYPVSHKVNNVRDDEPSLIERIAS